MDSSTVVVLGVMLVIVVFIVVMFSKAKPASSITPNPTPTPTPTPGVTPTPTATPKVTPTPTATPKVTPTPTPLIQVVYGQYIEYGFPSPTTIDSYVLQARKGVEMPVSFLLVGSNDRANWTIVSVQQNISWSDNQLQTFPLTTVVSNTYYRLIMTKMNANNTGVMSMYQFYPMYNNINFIQTNAVTYNANQWLNASNGVVVSISVSFLTTSPSNGTCSTLASYAVETPFFIQNNVYCVFPLLFSEYTASNNYTATYGTATPYIANVSGTPYAPPTPTPTATPKVTPTPTPTPTQTPVAPTPTPSPTPIPIVYGEYIAYDFPASTQIDSYVLQSRKAVDMPLSFVMMGSNNKVSWTIISVQQNVAWTDNTAQTFRLSATANYTNYRLIMTQMNANNEGFMSIYQFYPLYNSVNFIQKNAVTYTSNQWLNASNGVVVSISVSFPVTSPANGTCATLTSYAVETPLFVQNNVYCIFPLASSAYTAATRYIASSGTSTPYIANVSGTPFVIPTVTPTPTPTPTLTPKVTPTPTMKPTPTPTPGPTPVPVVYGEYVEYDFPASTPIDSYVMQARKAVDMPRSFLLLGSNDRGSWTIVSVQQNVSWTDNTAKTFKLASVVTYTYYRWVMTQMNASNSGFMSIYQCYPLYNSVNFIQNNAVTYTTNQWLNASNGVVVTILISYLPSSPANGTCSTLASFAIETASFVQSNVYCLLPIATSSYSTYTNYIATYGTNTPFIANVSGTAFTPAPYAPPYVPVTPTPTPTPTAITYPPYIPPVIIPWVDGIITKVWKSIAVSTSGQYITAVVYNANMYTSSDYGVTWKSASVPSASWSCVSISHSGQYQTAVAFNGAVYYSSNFGSTWTASSFASQSWTSVSMSASGQYQVGLVFNGQSSVTNAATGKITIVFGGIYYSTTYGMTWTVSSFPTPLPNVQDWSSVSMSKTGARVTAVSNNGYMYTSSDYGMTWTQVTSSAVASKKTWTAVTVSFDGSIQAATLSTGNVFVSTDSGVTWKACTQPPFVQGSILTQVCGSIAMSNYGSIMTCVVSNVGTYVSNDTGNTWQQDNTFSYAWVSCTMSGDGLFRAAAVSSGVISVWNNNPGTASPLFSWRAGSLLSPPTVAEPTMVETTLALIDNTIVAPANAWNVVKASTTGQYQIAGSQTGFYVSSMYGLNWTVILSTGNWTGVAMSADGMYMVAVQMNGGISYSSTYGKTWSNASIRLNAWNGVAMSANGKYVSAIITNGGIYYSSDYGRTWTASNAPTALWSSIAMSSDGTIQVATITNGYIYINQNVTTPVPYGSIWLLSGSAALAWSSVCMDTTGQYMTACVSNGGMYYSISKGVTWFLTNAPTKLWKSVTCTSNSMLQYACVYNGAIYTSTDRGMNWITATAPVAPWSSICISGDGSRISATNSISTIATFSPANLTFEPLYGEWIQLQFGSPVQVVAYHLVPRNNLTMCLSYVLLGSMNGYQWTYLTFQSNVVWNSNVPSLFYLNSTDVYLYLRMVIVQINPVSNVFELSGFCAYGPNGSVFGSSSNYVVSPYATNFLLTEPGHNIKGRITYSWSLLRTEDDTQMIGYMMTTDGYINQPSYLGFTLATDSTYNASGIANPDVAPLSMFQYNLPYPSMTPLNVSGEWVQVQLAMPTLLSGFKLVAGSGLVQNMPSSFVFLGSNDGVNWLYVCSATNVMYWIEGIPQTFPVVNAQIAYTYYRFVMTQGRQDNMDIGGLILLNAVGDSVVSSDLTQIVPQTSTLTYTALQVWIDASVLTVVDGGTLPSWSTPANSTPNTISSTGTYKANFINNKGVIKLSPGQTITVPNVSVSTNASVFIVFYSATEFPSIQVGTGFVFKSSVAQLYTSNGSSPSYMYNKTFTISQNIVQVAEVVVNSSTGTADMYINGTSAITSSAFTVVSTPTTLCNGTMTIQGNVPNSTSYVAEFMMFNTSLNNTQRQYVEGYLANKWGFSYLLPSTHPYYTQSAWAYTLIPSPIYYIPVVASIVSTPSSTSIPAIQAYVLTCVPSAITGSSQYSYQWSATGGNVASPVTISNPTSATTTIIAKMALGPSFTTSVTCLVTDLLGNNSTSPTFTVVWQAYAMPTSISVTNTPTPTQFGAGVQTSGLYTCTVTTPGTYSYQWSYSGGNTSAIVITNPTSISTTFTGTMLVGPASTTNISCRVTDVNNNTSSSTSTITWNPYYNLVPIISSTSSPTGILNQTSANYTCTATDGNPNPTSTYTYVWTIDGGGNVASTPIIANPTSATTTFSATMINGPPATPDPYGGTPTPNGARSTATCTVTDSFTGQTVAATYTVVWNPYYTSIAQNAVTCTDVGNTPTFNYQFNSSTNNTMSMVNCSVAGGSGVFSYDWFYSPPLYVTPIASSHGPNFPTYVSRLPTSSNYVSFTCSVVDLVTKATAMGYVQVYFTYPASLFPALTVTNMNYLISGSGLGTDTTLTNTVAKQTTSPWAIFVTGGSGNFSYQWYIPNTNTHITDLQTIFDPDPTNPTKSIITIPFYTGNYPGIVGASSAAYFTATLAYPYVASTTTGITCTVTDNYTKATITGSVTAVPGQYYNTIQWPLLVPFSISDMGYLCQEGPPPYPQFGNIGIDPIIESQLGYVLPGQTAYYLGPLSTQTTSVFVLWTTGGSGQFTFNWTLPPSPYITNVKVITTDYNNSPYDKTKLGYTYVFDGKVVTLAASIVQFQADMVYPYATSDVENLSKPSCTVTDTVTNISYTKSISDFPGPPTKIDTIKWARPKFQTFVSSAPWSTTNAQVQVLGPFVVLGSGGSGNYSYKFTLNTYYGGLVQATSITSNPTPNSAIVTTTMYYNYNPGLYFNNPFNNNASSINYYVYLHCDVTDNVTAQVQSCDIILSLKNWT